MPPLTIKITTAFLPLKGGKSKARGHIAYTPVVCSHICWAFNRLQPITCITFPLPVFIVCPPCTCTPLKSIPLACQQCYTPPLWDVMLRISCRIIQHGVASLNGWDNAFLLSDATVHPPECHATCMYTTTPIAVYSTGIS